MGAIQSKMLSEAALTSGMAGGTGAFLSTAVFYPVELVTTRIQASVAGTDGYQYNAGMPSALRSIIATQGVQGLYTGFLPVLVRSCAFDFTMPYFYGIISEIYEDTCSTPPGLLIGLFLRTLAGQCNAIVNSPLEIVTNRLMAARTASSVSQTFGSIVAEGGILNLWAGLGTSLILAINPALCFTLFDALKRIVAERTATHSNDSEERKPPAAQILLLLGVIAKALTLCVVYPLMRAKVLLQTTTGGTLLSTLREVSMTEGFAGLYKGMSAKFFKSLGSTALLLTTKDLTEQWLKRLRNPVKPEESGQTST